MSTYFLKFAVLSEITDIKFTERHLTHGKESENGTYRYCVCVFIYICETCPFNKYPPL